LRGHSALRRKYISVTNLLSSKPQQLEWPLLTADSPHCRLSALPDLITTASKIGPHSIPGLALPFHPN
ncbi:MAG: hypothetical protein VXX55_08035, partial [Planctomycetota bacterium]|nr:hypothetical protein [Planctomycetota bacterium]